MSPAKPKKISPVQKILLGVALVFSLLAATFPLISTMIMPLLHPKNAILGEAILSDPDITSWAGKIATDSVTFDATTITTVLPLAKTSFTAEGWRRFMACMDEYKIINTVKNDHLAVNLTVDETPKITEAMPRNGLYTWSVTMPITINYVGDHPEVAVHGELHMTVVRSDNPTNVKSVAIADWAIAKNSTNSMLSYPAH